MIFIENWKSTELDNFVGNISDGDDDEEALVMMKIGILLIVFTLLNTIPLEVPRLRPPNRNELNNYISNIDDGDDATM